MSCPSVLASLGTWTDTTNKARNMGGGGASPLVSYATDNFSLQYNIISILLAVPLCTFMMLYIIKSNTVSREIFVKLFSDSQYEN
jgi:hypothetical protein